MTVDPFSDGYVPPVWDTAHSIPTSGHQTEKVLVRIAEIRGDADGGLLTKADVLFIKTEFESQSLDPAALNFWDSQIDKLPLGVRLSIESLADADLHPVLAHALGSTRPADYIASYGSRFGRRICSRTDSAASHQQELCQRFKPTMTKSKPRTV